MYVLVRNGSIIEHMQSPLGDVMRFLPPYGESYPCLYFIDPYDDTIFTGYQMGAFLPEWQRLSLLAETSEEKKFVAYVEALARRCQNPAPDPFLYLKYLGD